jgi:hypothetical protein
MIQRYRVALLTGLLASFLSSLQAQQRIDAVQLYHRVWVAVPMIGTGKGDDPRRPIFMPRPSQQKADKNGILAMHCELSDDGNTALVELVVADRSTANTIFSAAGLNLPALKVFEKGKNTQAEVEAEFQKYKKSFKFNPLTTARVP